MNTINKQTKRYSQDIIVFLFLAVAVGYLCWRAPFGFGVEDESGYLAFPFRFLLGDSMLTDEWSTTQLFSILTYLPVKLFVKAIDSTEGIILTFRYLYIVFQSIISILVYCRFRKYGIISLFAVLIFIFYIPLCIFNFSYLSLTSDFAILIALLLTSKINFFNLFLIGILFSCLVLCNPFLAILYFIYSIIIVFILIINKNYKNFHSEYLSLKTWLCITSGIFLLALIFLIFLLSKTSITELYKNTPQIFKDPEYILIGKRQNMINVKETLMGIININPILFVLNILLFTILIFDKNRISRKILYLISESIIAFLYIIVLLTSSNYFKYGLCMFPLTLLGFICYILSKSKNKHVFIFFWCWGILIAIFQDLASDQEGYYSMSIGLVTSVLGSLIFIKNIIDELADNLITNPYNKSSKYNKGRRITVSVFMTLFIFQVGFEYYTLADIHTVCFEYFYSKQLNISYTNEKLVTKITNGPAKGLLTTEDSANIYNDILSDLSNIRNSGKGSILVTAKYPWIYLYTGMPYATYTAWFLIDKLPETLNRLSDYYDIHPNKRPDYIYIPQKFSLFIPDEYFGDYIQKFTNEVISNITQKYTYNITKGKAGYIVKIIK